MEAGELDLSSKETFGRFNHTRESFANVALDMFYSKDNCKIQVLKDKNGVLWENKRNQRDYVKMLTVFLDPEGNSLLDMVECNHHQNDGADHATTNHLHNHSECEDVVHRKTKMAKDGGVWKTIDQSEFCLRLDGLLTRLPETHEEERLPGNMELFKPTKKPKYFAIDLDGTFLTFNTENMVENIKTFQKLREHNYTPFFCTARCLTNYFDPFLDLLKAHSDYRGFPGVYNNGATVYNERGEFVYKACFGKEYLRKMVKYVKKAGLEDGALFYEPPHYYCLADPVRLMSRMVLFYDFFKTVKVDEESLLEKEVVMVYLMVRDDNDLVVDSETRIVQDVDHTLHVSLFGLFSELFPLGTSKYMGVRKLIDYFGSVDPEMGGKDDVYFIGDGENDVDIMKFLDYSFSVANAPNSVKKCSKFIMDHSNYQGAVHRLLNFVYFGHSL